MVSSSDRRFNPALVICVDMQSELEKIASALGAYRRETVFEVNHQKLTVLCKARKTSGGSLAGSFQTSGGSMQDP